MAVMAAVWMPMMAMDADGDGGDAAGGDGGVPPAVGGGGGVSGAGGEQGAAPAQTHEAALRGGGEGPHNISGSRPTSKPYST